MKGKHLSARTAYLAPGSRECLSFISAKPPHEGEAGNRVGCIRTVDGGLSFEFLSWDFLSTVKITEPHSNPPALLKLADGRLAWKSTNVRASYSSPIVATIGDQPHVIFAARFNVVSLDPRTLLLIRS